MSLNNRECFFTVVITTHNRSEMLKHAMQGILSQEFRDWELIIADDASQDNTAEVVKGFADSRIKYIRQTTNKQVSSTRNLGFSISTGQYICFHDDDDYYLPQHLFFLHKEIMHRSSPVAFFYTGLALDRGNGPQKELMKPIGSQHPVRYVLENAIIPSRTCIHRDIVRKHQFNESIYERADMELWTRVLINYPLYYVEKYTVVEVFHDDNMSNRKNNVAPDQIKALNIMFSNPQIAQIAGSTIKRNMYQGSYYLMALYYEKTGNYFNMLKALIISVYYVPSYQLKAKMVMLIYNFPLLVNFFRRTK